MKAGALAFYDGSHTPAVMYMGLRGVIDLAKPFLFAFFLMFDIYLISASCIKSFLKNTYPNYLHGEGGCMIISIFAPKKLEELRRSYFAWTVFLNKRGVAEKMKDGLLKNFLLEVVEINAKGFFIVIKMESGEIKLYLFRKNAPRSIEIRFYCYLKIDSSMERIVRAIREEVDACKMLEAENKAA